MIGHTTELQMDTWKDRWSDCNIHPPTPVLGGGYKECMKQRQIHVDNATDSETAEATETVRQQQTGR